MTTNAQTPSPLDEWIDVNEGRATITSPEGAVFEITSNGLAFNPSIKERAPYWATTLAQAMKEESDQNLAIIQEQLDQMKEKR